MPLEVVELEDGGQFAVSDISLGARILLGRSCFISAAYVMAQDITLLN